MPRASQTAASTWNAISPQASTFDNLVLWFLSSYTPTAAMSKCHPLL